MQLARLICSPGCYELIPAIGAGYINGFHREETALHYARINNIIITETITATQ